MLKRLKVELVCRDSSKSVLNFILMLCFSSLALSNQTHDKVNVKSTHRNFFLRKHKQPISYIGINYTDVDLRRVMQCLFDSSFAFLYIVPGPNVSRVALLSFIKANEVVWCANKSSWGELKTKDNSRSPHFLSTDHKFALMFSTSTHDMRGGGERSRNDD